MRWRIWRGRIMVGAGGLLGAPYIFLVIAMVAAFWLAFISYGSVTSYYSIEEFNFFRQASFWQILPVMEFGEAYKRFSPLGFGLIGWLDAHVYVPLLGLSDRPTEELVIARRMVWLHPLFAALSCLVTGAVVWRIFRDHRLVVAAVLMVGLSDTVPFQMRFVSTFACYVLQISAILAVYFLWQLEKERSFWHVLAVALSVTAALSVWEQGLDLVFVVCVILALSIAEKRYAGERVRDLPEMSALAAVLAIAAIYLAIRLRTGAAEALTANKEASYFFAYRRLLPMLDDLILNFSGLSLQAFRQFLPFPPLSFSVMSKTDMNALNLYNTYYAQFPNMFYRMMGMWYSGIAFAMTIAVTVYMAWLAKASDGPKRRLIIISLCMFIFGSVMHLPIMHRDYFYIPGFALGFKISIGYMGFVMIMVILAHQFLLSPRFLALNERRKSMFLFSGAVFFCLAAISRAMFGQLPNRFPW